MAEIELRLFGFPEIRRGGRPVALRLKKALALFAYVAESRAPVSREAAAALLWPEADGEAARARLRRTLHRLQAALGAAPFAADRAALALSPALPLRVDAQDFEAACARGEFAAAAALCQGDYLAGFAPRGCPEFEEWAFFRREALRSRLVQALERLVEADLGAGHARQAAAHAARLASLDPSSETAHRQLIRAHLAAGDRNAAERAYAACARILEAELGRAPEAATRALLGPAARAPTESAPPPTRYAPGDGIHLAYQTIASGARDIVVVPGFVSHVERIWDDARARAFVTALAGLGRVILFDRRGVGLSDRIGAPPTAEATAADLGAVLDAAGSRNALLIGASEGGPGCIRFAAERPGRLAGLVLWGSLAKGSRARDYPFALTRAQYDAWLGRLIGGWGGPAGIETFAPSLAADREARAWWAGLLRAASSPGAIKGVLEALRDTDVRPLLRHLSVPTLVLHRRGDRAVRLAAGRHLARAIPGARLVELDGADHWMWAGDQAPVLAAIRDFAEG